MPEDTGLHLKFQDGANLTLTKIQIKVDLFKTGDQTTLRVSDNGIGLPEGFDINTTDTLGWRLIGLLAKQIEGKLTIETKKGTIVLLSFIV
jgi:two-component sensor histidine kinase